jgi:hypothetical protein
MKLSCDVTIDDSVIKIKDHKIIHMSVNDREAARVIVDLGIIPEMAFIEKMIDKMANEFHLDLSKPIILAASNKHELIYTLGLFMSLFNENSVVFGPKSDQTFQYIGKIKNPIPPLDDEWLPIEYDLD